MPSADGVSDFSVLQNELCGRSSKLELYGFDLMYLNGYDLRKLGLIDRKKLLKTLIAKSNILYSEGFEHDGPTFLKSACGMGLERVVSKVRDSKYISARTNDWVKVTCRQRETLTVVGYAMKGNQFDGVFIGRREGAELLYAGKVDHGFTADSAMDVRERLGPLVQKSQAYSRKIKAKGIWVKPSLSAEIEYRAKSAEGKLRHPFFKGFRDDLRRRP